MARNCGLLARDLTEAAYNAGSRGRERYSSYSDSPEIRMAEQAIRDRIHELEGENFNLVERVKMLEAGYDDLRNVCDRLRPVSAKKETDSVF